MKFFILLGLSIGALFAQPTISTSSLPQCTVGQTYSSTLAATGGTSPYSNWTVASGTLPTGLSLNSATGAITGTPTVTGVSALTFTVQDSLGATSVAKSLPITINVLPTIVTTTLPNGIFGTEYNHPLVGTGGTLPYKWYVPSGNGTLCGPMINSGGQIFGIHVVVGTCNFTLEMIDTNGLGAAVSQSYTITVASGSPAALIGKGCTTAINLDDDCDGFGVGPGMLPDADDTDPTVNTTATVISTYGSIAAFLTHLGYSHTHIVYVSATGNDTTCVVNDITKPCLTFAKALTLAVAGDTILVRGGNYGQFVINKSGNSSNWFTVMSYPGELAIPDTPSPNCGVNSNIVSHTGYSYWRIVGLWIDPQHHTGIGQCSGYQDGIVGGTVGPVFIKSNFISHVRWGVEENPNVNGIVISHNVIMNIAVEHDIYLGQNDHNDGTTPPITGTIISGNVLGRSMFSNLHINGQYTGVLVEDNIMWSAQTGIELQDGVMNSTFQNNVLFNHSQQGIVLYNYNGNSLIFAHDQSGNKFINNSIWEGNKSYNGGGTLSSSDTLRMTDGSPVTPTGPQGKYPPLGYANPYGLDMSGLYANNVITSNGATQFYIDQHAIWLAGNQFFNNNLNPNPSTRVAVWGAGNNPGCQTTYNQQEMGTCPTPVYDLPTLITNFPSNYVGNVLGDPLFVNANSSNWGIPTAFDLSLSSGSPAATLSNATYAPTFDLRGNVRGTTSAAGAYASNSPILTVSPTTTSYNFIIGGATPANQTITVDSLGVVLDNWSATTAQTWITLTPASGIAAGTFALGIDVTGLTMGTYSGSVSVASTTTGITNSPVTVTVNLTVANPPVSVTTTSLPNGVWTSTYTTTLSAIGGTAPYTWAVSTGTLPVGLSLGSSTGIITGTAGTPTGGFNFAVIATDSTSIASAPKNLAINIPAPIAKSTIGGFGARGR